MPRTRASYAELRLQSAFEYPFTGKITGYLTNFSTKFTSGDGHVFNHPEFENGERISTSKIQAAEKQGKFWVISTRNSRYVIASFKRNVGRPALFALFKELNIKPAYS